MDKVSLAPAERAEILVDFSKYNVGDKISLRDGNFELMTINIVEESNMAIEIPKDLVEIADCNRDDIVNRRLFLMSGMGPMVAINCKQMNMDRIDEKLYIGELEEWVISNES
jgi:FtsP/CotA-like multicopper oxidase with cupredoxin domain